MSCSVSMYIGKDSSVGCVYGEKCLKTGLCSDIIDLLKEKLTARFPFEVSTAVNNVIMTITNLSSRPYNFDLWRIDGNGNNCNVYQFARKLDAGVRCNTNINVNHPDAEEIRDAILKAVELLTKDGYKVEKS